VGFDKNYPNRKDWRKPHHKVGRYDRSCRPGGSRLYCQGNRTQANTRRFTAACEQIDEDPEE
jgi:hypothetical protein